MNSAKNIFNAFDVITQTYNSVYKLIEFCKNRTQEKGEYVLMTPKFLRYKSDNYIDGWAIRSFILLFQSSNDEIIKSNNWRNGPVYLLEINLFEPEAYDIPMAHIAKYEYATGEIDRWQEGCSPADHWCFYDPMYSNELEYKDSDSADFYDASVVNEEYANKKWWGLRRIVGYAAPLTDITSENADEMIFGRFDLLSSK